MNLKKSSRSVAVAFALTGVASVAGAAGFQINEQGASGLGMSFSGAAAAVWDASTVWWNPAGMSAIPGRQVVAAGDILFTSHKFSDQGSTLPPGQPPNAPRGNGGDAGGTFFIPSLFVTWQLSPEWWAGLGINGPFGLTTKWDDDFVGRFHAIKSEIATYNINPSFAWKPLQSFSIGGGLDIMYLDGKFTQYTNYSGAVGGTVLQRCLAAGRPLTVCQGLANNAIGSLVSAGQNQGLATADGNSWALGWNIGAMLDLTPSTRVGLTYRSAVKQKVEGDITFDNRPAALNTALANSGVKADVKLPQSFSLAVSQGIGPNWRVLGDYTWTGWSTIQELAFTRVGAPAGAAPLPPTELKFKDSWRAGLGAEWQVNSAWLMRFGVAYDRTPVQDEYRTPRLPDNSRWWLSIGGRYSWAPNWAVDFGYSYFIVDDAPINLTNDTASTGNLIGNVKTTLNLIGAQVRWNF